MSSFISFLNHSLLCFRCYKRGKIRAQKIIEPNVWIARILTYVQIARLNNIEPTYSKIHLFPIHLCQRYILFGFQQYFIRSELYDKLGDGLNLFYFSIIDKRTLPFRVHYFCYQTYQSLWHVKMPLLMYTKSISATKKLDYNVVLTGE